MRCEPRNSGSALIFSMIALAVLTAMIAGTMQRSQVDTSLAGNWKREAQAKSLAETGLAIAARKVLDEYNAHKTINGILETLQLGTSGGGEFSVDVRDNDDINGVDQDGDGSEETDFDRRFRLAATGSLGSIEKEVEAFFEINDETLTPPDSSGIGALGFCANNANLSRAANVQGADYNLPGYPCSGSHCNGTASSNPSGAGVSYNTGTTVNRTGGNPGGNPGINSNAAINCGGWNTFLSSAATIAHSSYSAAAGPFNASALATNFGTPAAPKIVVINGPGTAQFNGNLFGNGILIIRNASAVFNGTFTYAGLILIEDEGGGITVSGSSQIFGSTMVLNASAADAQVEVNIGSSGARIRYSTQGLARAALALQNTGGDSASLTLLTWRTVTN